MKKNIFVVGLGLIGSSLALCIKKEFPEYCIYGSDAATESQLVAKKKGIIDEIATNFSETAVKADVILLAVPVEACLHILDSLKRLPLKPTVLVTDVSSTKQAVMAATKDSPFAFVGGHPMAGSHKSGVLAADENLFENAYYIFTPHETTTRYVPFLETLLRGTRGKFVELTPQEHDEITGMLSHLPHIIAASLVKQSQQLNERYPRASQLAAGGFRDITRIASSDPRMWTDILLTNQVAILEQLDTWQNLMREIRQLINEKDEASIFQFFDNARTLRDNLPVHQNGAIPAFHDLLVDVPDTPGVIAEVTGLLGTAGISITNLRIHETREEVIGVLQLSFRSQKELLAGKKCIEEHTTYSCRLK